MTCERYTPDYQAMGDCFHCGRLKEDHEPKKVNQDAPPSIMDAEFWEGET